MITVGNLVGHTEFVVTFVTLLGGFYLLHGKIEHQCERTDRLYELYVESNDKWNQKWQDTNKAIAESNDKWNQKWQESNEKWSQKYIEANDKFYALLKEKSSEKK